MTKTAEDAAIVYAAIARNAPDHFYSRTYDGGVGHGLPEPTVALFEDVQDLKDVRIGIFKEWFDDSSENVRDLCQTAINSLVKRGGNQATSLKKMVDLFLVLDFFYILVFLFLHMQLR